MKIASILAPLVLATIGVSCAQAATNLITPGLSITTNGAWSGNPQQPLNAPLPENTWWTSGSFWWSGQEGVPTWAVSLGHYYNINHFIAQVDDNDSYLLQYWNGASWQTAWNIPAVYTFGLVTRDSGILASPVTTNALRVSAVSGDGSYSISNLQAFAVPGPIVGAGIPALLGWAGFGLWRRKRAAAA